MPFRMKNSPATFQRLINMTINGLHIENCDAYIDDVIIYNDAREEHLTTIWRLFDRLGNAQLTHVKLKAFSDFPVPSCRKQLMRFLDMAEYY